MKEFILVIFFLTLIIFSFIFVFADVIKQIMVGIFGRKKTIKKLKKFAKNNDFLFLSDIRLLMQNGQVLKIDALLLADRQIYVISNKIWLGDLTGLALDEKWLLYQGKRLIHVLNPLKQNEATINFLCQLLATQRDDFVNVVVFPSTINLDDIRTDKNQLLIGERKLLKAIKQNEKNKELGKFTGHSLEEAANTILSYHIRTKKEVHDG